jgi:hypothetical protein
MLIYMNCLRKKDQLDSPPYYLVEDTMIYLPTQLLNSEDSQAVPPASPNNSKSPTPASTGGDS